MSASDLTEARHILQDPDNKPALLVGNGINLLQSSRAGRSWDDLMKTLVDEAIAAAPHTGSERTRLPKLIERDEQQQTPVSLPELFDIIGITSHAAESPSPAQPRVSLQKRIVELLGDMHPGPAHRTLVDWAHRTGVPILTTNYDHCFQSAFPGPLKRRHFSGGTPMSRYYPWDRYYAPQAISNPDREFAIWHLHGDSQMSASIRAGLDQYLGMVERLRSIVHPIAREILGPLLENSTSTPTSHRAPWLKVFMGRKLVIQGLGLRSAEVSLRWLLIQRYRNWHRYRPELMTQPTGWYLHSPTDIVGPLDPGRRTFFESVGLRVLELKTEQDSYETLYGSSHRST